MVAAAAKSSKTCTSPTFADTAASTSLAITQLQVVGKQIDIPVFADETPGANPVDIARRAVEQSTHMLKDCLLYTSYRSRLVLCNGRFSQCSSH